MNGQSVHIIFAHMHIDSVLIWGAVATIVLTTIMFLSQGLGFSRISLPFMIGTMFTANRDRANIYGFIGHFVFGWLFSLLYAVIFESIGFASVWLGLLIGSLHGLFVLSSMMPLLPFLHPRMATEHEGSNLTRMLEPPGFLGLNYGRRTPAEAFLAHLAYGAILNGFYKVVS